MSLLVVQPGLGSTVQDLGRTGYREWGVPVGGAFDRLSHELANALLGNPLEAATVELTVIGGVYRAETELALALAGAPMEASVKASDGALRALTLPQTVTLKVGDELILRGTPRGARTYLAVRGGWQTPAVLGSRSSEVRLRGGERLPASPGPTLVRRLAEDGLPSPPGAPLRVIPGPDAALLPDGHDWHQGDFQVAPQCDRMGVRLDGPHIDVRAEADRMSAPVAPGAIQVAGGRLIVLGVACGTMGGYPHVAHVVSADLNRLGQARPGDRLRFELVSLAEARRLDREVRRVHGQRLAQISGVAATGGMDN